MYINIYICIHIFLFSTSCYYRRLDGTVRARYEREASCDTFAARVHVCRPLYATLLVFDAMSTSTAPTQAPTTSTPTTTTPTIATPTTTVPTQASCSVSASCARRFMFGVSLFV